MTKVPPPPVAEGHGNSLFEFIVENCSDAIIVIDDSRRITYVNGAAIAIFGSEANALIGASLNTLIPPRFHESHDELLETFRSSDVRARYMEDRSGSIVGIRSDGTEFPIEVSILKGTGPSGPFAAAMVHDVTKQRRLREMLEEQATLDPLTGIMNRLALYARAEEECARSTRYGEKLTVAMIDIDRFKNINDNHGHATGDDAINHVVDIICREIRTTDILGRWGGEEFIVMMPSTSEQKSLVLAQRLRKAIAKETMPIDNDPETRLPITISIGIAGFRPERESFDDLIERADKALYRAKKTGRNRVCSLTPEDEKIGSVA